MTVLRLIINGLAVTLAAQTIVLAAELSHVSNYRQYSDSLSSSGQPSAAQLQQAAAEGFERVIYLAFTDNDSAIEHEDSIVKKLGMDYVHIPVDFDRPTVDDFRAFVRVMESDDARKTLVHCQVNFRASTFSFLYRVIFLNAPLADAKRDLDTVWAPNENWYRFIRSTFKQYGLSHECEGCDWGEHEFIDS